MTKAILSGRSPCKHQALTRVMVHLPTKLCIIDQSWAAARCRLSETNLRVKWEARRRQLLDLGYAVVPGWLQLRCPKGAEKGNVGSIPLCFQCQYIGISHISHIQRIVIWLIQLKLRISPCRVWFHVQDRSAKPLHRPAGQQQQVAWPLKLKVMAAAQISLNLRLPFQIGAFISSNRHFYIIQFQNASRGSKKASRLSVPYLDGMTIGKISVP